MSQTWHLSEWRVETQLPEARADEDAYPDLAEYRLPGAASRTIRAPALTERLLARVRAALMSVVRGLREPRLREADGQP